METTQIPKYHIAPHFSIPPVEAGGILEPGSIIANISSADEPLNGNCQVRVPHAKLFCSHQKGFTATRSRMRSGEYGFWARMLGLDGMGGELSWAHARSVEDVYNFRGIDTIYFNPSQEYMEESMHLDDVKEHVMGSGYEPVYMVTGLKTARGPSVRMSESRKTEGTVEVGVQNPGGLPVELGPKLNTSKEVRQEMGFEDCTDFIVGIRIKKLMYKKHWLTRAPGALDAKEHNKGATMVDDSVVKQGADEVVDLGDDTENDDEVEAEEVGNQTLATRWVVRQA